MINKINITVQHSIVVNKSCEEVFDFTQDFSKRMLWDKSIVDCKLISETSVRTAFIKAKGGMTANLEYKLFERPHKTSLRMTNINSSLVIDGGGSWTYEDQNGKNNFVDTNQYSIFKNFFYRKNAEEIC
ncbi:MAG: SRPBCC family protein [Bacteroidota bacterium]